MASQIRYFDYMAPITSKGEGEHIALSVGIGPLLGFDRATIDMGTGSLVITSSNDDSNLPNKNKDLYLANVDMAIQMPSHIVVTPDGILTTIQGALNISFNPNQVGTYKELVVMANHTYSPIDGGTVTTFTCIPNSTATSMLTRLMDGKANMKTWYDVVNTMGNIEKNKSVIVGLYSVDSSNVVTAYNPYNNRWPQPYPLTKAELDAILSAIANLEYRQTTQDKILSDILNQDRPSFRGYVNLSTADVDRYILSTPTGGILKVGYTNIDGNTYSWDLIKEGTPSGIVAIQRLANNNFKVFGKISFRFSIPAAAKTAMNGSTKFRLSGSLFMEIKKQWVGLEDMSGFLSIAPSINAFAELITTNSHSPYNVSPDINTAGEIAIINADGAGSVSKEKEYIKLRFGYQTAFVVPESVNIDNLQAGGSANTKPTYVNVYMTLDANYSK